MKNTILYKIWAKFLTWFGDIMFQVTPANVKAKDIRKFLSLIQSGDIVLRRYDEYLDGKFISGKYSHSGIVLNKDTMIHSIAEGVQYIDSIDYVDGTDGFIILRFPTLNVKKANAFAQEMVIRHTPYDFLFDKTQENAYYCHEFSNAYLNHGGVCVKIEGNIIYGNDFIESKQAKIIWETPY